MSKMVAPPITLLPPVQAPLAAAAAAILDTIDTYHVDFLDIARRARRRFESRDWQGRQHDADERIDLYEHALNRAVAILEARLGASLRSQAFWAELKEEFAGLIAERHDAELAETFFNSVTRKIFSTVGINRDIEFFHVSGLRSLAPLEEVVYTHYASDHDTGAIIRRILADHGFAMPYEDLERDAELVAREVDLYLWPLVGNVGSYAIEVINAPFYRNKVAYLVGRIQAGHHVLPFVLPLYHGERGVFVDTVLLTFDDVSTVFSFAFSYFHVEVRRHDELIAFLRSILPGKPLAELYNAIGYERHGKTELYRDLHRFIHESNQQFVIAAGKEGSVMIAFTLPDYNFVFKVIKDRPVFLRSREVAPKGVTRTHVMSQYEFVRRRDRVGRMVDTQEFENLRFRRARFSPELLAEFVEAARESVAIDREFVVVRHLYVQRKVMPLPMYLENERDPETLRRVVLDFGYFLRDLAAAGIFLGDLFNTWNYGVTRSRRIVLFDHDDVMPIEQAEFLEKPRPRDDDEELEPEEDRVVARPGDFFVDEISRYAGFPTRLHGIFDSTHADLFTVAFWRSIKARVERGDMVDIAPYDRKKRFRFEVPLQ